MARPTARLIASTVAALLASPAMAVAQAAPSTPPAQVVATAPSGATAPQQQPDRQVTSTNDQGADRDDTDDQGSPTDRRLHGEISIGVGTNGYREVSGAATGPIGDNGQATIAIDAGQFGVRRR